MKFKHIHVIINPAAGKHEPILALLDKTFFKSRSKLQVYRACQKNEVFAIAYTSFLRMQLLDYKIK